MVKYNNSSYIVTVQYNRVMYKYATVIHVPDLVSRNRDVVLVRRIFSSGKPRGVGNLEWGGNGKGMEWGGNGKGKRRGRSVCE
jgi:hypothetical protein